MYFDAGFSDKQHHDMMQKVRYIYILEQMAFQHIYVMSVPQDKRYTPQEQMCHLIGLFS